MNTPAATARAPLLRRRTALAALGVSSLLPLGACAPVSTLRCMPGEAPAVRDLLFLGTDRPDGGRVSPAEWEAFLREVVTPRFPAGLTAWPASGQWRGADGSIVREASYVLQLMHAPTPEGEAAVREIVADYKTRFRQESVLRVRGADCVSL